MSWDPEILVRRYMQQGSTQVPEHLRGVAHYDHLLTYTSLFDEPSDMVRRKQLRMTSLWLTSYLAHWGMFRGSSQLKRTNVLFFDEVARALLNSKTGALRPVFGVEFNQLHELDRGAIRHVLTTVAETLKSRGVSPTATLVSKLILGLTGTVPGYDRFVSLGIKRLIREKRYAGSAGFSESGLRALSAWCAEQTWPQVACRACPSVQLPPARLADMALSIYGGAGETR